jgi:predicted nucleic acid-binding protein
MLFVYWLEDKKPYSERISAIRRRMADRRDTLCSSSFTLGELLVAPEKLKDTKLRETILTYFSGPDLEVLSFDSATATRYAKIRAAGAVTPADAIHLACAATAGVDLFLTNDKALHKLVVPGIQFIDGLETTVLGLVGL